MEEEELSFEIVLSGTWWSKKPQFSIWMDESVVLQSEIRHTSPYTVKFTRTVSSGEHSLKIRLENKTSEDTITNDQGEILSDMLLNIEDITINDVSIESLRWVSSFYLDSPQIYQNNEITQLDRCVNLGWNGTYVLKFSSPYYIWLLENLN